MTTRGSGLLRWNRTSNKIEQLTTKDGLAHDFLYSIHEDKKGFFWIPTNDGLMRFNPSNYSNITFKKEDGLACNEFNTFSKYVAPSGKIFLGGINGLIEFDPEDLKFFGKEKSFFRNRFVF